MFEYGGGVRPSGFTTITISERYRGCTEGSNGRRAIGNRNDQISMCGLCIAEVGAFCSKN